MIIDHISFYLGLSTLVLIIIIVNQWKTKCKSSSQKLPPGPPKLPLIGNLHQLIGPLPHHTLANLAKKHGPIMHLQLGEHHAVVISSSEIAKEVLRTKEASFAQRPSVIAIEITSYDRSGLFAAPYGDYWKHVRKIFMVDLLSAKCVKLFRSIREEEAWDMVETICQGNGAVINLTPILFSWSNNIISRAAVGMRCKDQEELMLLLVEVITMAAGFNLADLFPSIRLLRYITGIQPAMEKVHKKLSRILDGVIEAHHDKRRKQSGPRDILDVLVEHQDSNQLHDNGSHLTNNNLKGIILEIFSAGSETTSSTMEWTMSELLKNPMVMEKAQAEVREAFNGKTRIEETDVQKVSYLKLVVKETMRLHPAGALLPREARETCEISGYTIPIKTKVIINTWALGRDPNNWSDPDAFKPERFLIDISGKDYEFFPFGAGRRMCPGELFGTANVELALAQLLYHFDWTLPHGIKPQELDMSERFGITINRKHNLELIPTLRVPFKN